MARLTRAQRRRLRHIGAVAARHGFGQLVGPVGWGRLVPFHRYGLSPFQRYGWGRRSELTFHTGPEHVRLALQELGVTFVKLGQIASTRGDLVPPAYQTELALLQDSVPPTPTDVVLATIASELGRDPSAVFSRFELQPVAAASIGQAHAALLRDGSDVIVKVRRPDVVAQVDDDLAILGWLADRSAKRSATVRRLDLPAIVAQFAATLRAELDYRTEGHNAERFAVDFADDAAVHIPAIHWPASTSQILTLEHMHGFTVSDTQRLASSGLDRGALARRAAQLLMRMVFEHGFFHADPHPGNFFIEPDGTIALIDFGMVGTVDDATRQHLGGLLAAFAFGDGDALVDNVIALGAANSDVVDRDALRQDLLRLATDQLERSLDDLSVGSLLSEVLAVVRQHHLVLPANLALLVKMIVMCEGVGAQIDPSFRLVDVLLPFLAGGAEHPGSATSS